MWTVETHTHKERTNDWYWGLGVIAVAGVVASVFFGNGLLAIIIGIGALSIGFLVARGPREHTVKIHRRGISVDGTLYRYSSVQSFWVEHDMSHPHLFLSMEGFVTPRFSFPLTSESQGEQIRNYLKPLVKEEEQGPHLGEHLAEIFGL